MSAFLRSSISGVSVRSISCHSSRRPSSRGSATIFVSLTSRTRSFLHRWSSGGRLVSGLLFSHSCSRFWSWPTAGLSSAISFRPKSRRVRWFMVKTQSGIFSTWSKFTCRYVLFSGELVPRFQVGEVVQHRDAHRLGRRRHELPHLVPQDGRPPIGPHLHGFISGCVARPAVPVLALSLCGVASTPRSVLVRAASRCVGDDAASSIVVCPIAWCAPWQPKAAAPLCAWPSLPKMDERAKLLRHLSQRPTPSQDKDNTTLPKQSAGFQTDSSGISAPGGRLDNHRIDVHVDDVAAGVRVRVRGRVEASRDRDIARVVVVVALRERKVGRAARRNGRDRKRRRLVRRVDDDRERARRRTASASKKFARAVLALEPERRAVDGAKRRQQRAASADVNFLTNGSISCA